MFPRGAGDVPTEPDVLSFISFRERLETGSLASKALMDPAHRAEETLDLCNNPSAISAHRLRSDTNVQLEAGCETTS